MSKDTNHTAGQCKEACETAFIRYTARKRAGGIEALRVCREACRRPE